MEEALLQYLHASLRGADAAGGALAFDTAACQLQLLQHAGSDLTEELLERAKQLVGSKQVRD